MKDVTAESFGLVIAFLLPGVTGLYGLSFWADDALKLVQTLSGSDASLGVFLSATLAALVIGLEVTLVRWVVFEKIICRKHKLDKEFEKLGNEDVLLAYQAAVDQHYRYHQFWGGMTVVMPMAFGGWIVSKWDHAWIVAFATAGFAALEVLTAMAAIVAYEAYVSRSRSILEGRNA